MHMVWRRQSAAKAPGRLGRRVDGDRVLALRPCLRGELGHQSAETAGAAAELEPAFTGASDAGYGTLTDLHSALNEQSEMLRRSVVAPRSWHLMKAIEAFFADVESHAPWWVDETWFPVIDWEPFL